MRTPFKHGLGAASALGVALALASSEAGNAAPKNDPAAPSSIAESDGLQIVSGAGRSTHFDAVAPHLHLGGSLFGYMDVDGDVEKIAGMIRQFLDKVPAGELPPNIATLDLGMVLSDLGIDGIEAMGMSSYKNGDLYHNRAFLYVPEGRKGLLKLSGGEPGAFVATELAPEDADLVIEQTFNVRAAYEVAGKMIKHFGGAEALVEFKREMSEVNPQLGLTMADLLGKLDTRLTVVGRVHPDKPLDIPEAPMAIPSFDLLVAFDDLDWLYEKITGNMKEQMPPDQVAQMFIKGDGFERIAMPPMPSPEMVLMQPVIHRDIASKRVYLATTQAYLDECLSGKSKLADSADFKAATAGLPGEGNGLSYVSSDLSKTIRGMLKGASDATNGPMGAQETAIMSLVMMLLPPDDYGQAKVTVNRPDGIFVTSNSTASMKEGVIMGGASFLATFAGLTVKRVSHGGAVIDSSDDSTPSEHVPAEEVPGSEAEFEIDN